MLRKIPCLCVLLLLPVWGCSGGGPKDAAEALEDKSTLDVLQEAGEDEYDPPADGRLTQKQIEMYLEVKKREKDLLEVAAKNVEESTQKVDKAEKSGQSVKSVWEGLQALGDLGDFFTADIRAAQELGYNTAEYQWVKEQVMLAGLQSMSDQMRESLKEMAPDALGEEEEDKDAEAARYNAALLREYKSEIELLQAEITKYQQSGKER